MNSLIKNSISICLLCLVVFFQAFTFIDQININKGINSSISSDLYQIYEEPGLNQTNLLLPDKSEIISFRIDVDHTLFYTFPTFDLDSFHSLVSSIYYNLSGWINIKFSTSDIIFPFAYFW